jgi:ferredoxin
MSNETITKKLLLLFPQCETEKPIVYHLVKDYNLIINIFRAKVTPEEEGYLVLDVTGTEEDIEKGMQYVKTFNVIINETHKGVIWDEDRCTHCGNCLPHCPTDALYIKDRKTMQIAFNDKLCVECLSCIDNCPFGACSSIF